MIGAIQLEPFVLLLQKRTGKGPLSTKNAPFGSFAQWSIFLKLGIPGVALTMLFILFLQSWFLSVPGFHKIRKSERALLVPQKKLQKKTKTPIHRNHQGSPSKSLKLVCKGLIAKCGGATVEPKQFELLLGVIEERHLHTKKAISKKISKSGSIVQTDSIIFAFQLKRRSGFIYLWKWKKDKSIELIYPFPDRLLSPKRWSSGFSLVRKQKQVQMYTPESKDIGNLVFIGYLAKKPLKKSTLKHLKSLSHFQRWLSVRKNLKEKRVHVFPLLIKRASSSSKMGMPAKPARKETRKLP